MDLDRYLATHRPQWERLSVLSKGGYRKAKNRSGEEITELVALYQSASTSLSFVRTNYPDPALVGYLTRLVSKAGSSVYGTRPRTLKIIADFFIVSFPAAVYRARKFVWVSAALTLIPALVAGFWIANSPSAADAILPPALRDAYLNHDFQDYYQAHDASRFGSHVYTNNVGVAILAFALGIFFCLPTAYVLINNGVNLGLSAGLFARYGEQSKFWGLVLPHGMIEITSVIIAGAAGLKIGWALVEPGERKRSVALAEEGRRLVAITLGLFISLLIAGTIEGGVTGQPWPTWVRVGIGVIAESSFVGYLVYFGRRAHANGYSGVLGETDRSGWAANKAVET